MDDRDAITDVLARYGRALDDRDFGAVGRCFTADARATFSGVEIAPGRDAIVAHLRGLSALAASTHLFGLPVIELAGDGMSARVETAAVAHLVTTAPGSTVRTRGLRYRDVFVRTGAGGPWQIHQRIHRVDWMAEQPAVPPSTR
ncbi:MAG: nuclear transport factor 2 family protein [Ilumatobacteraceae bacterium]|nr:nuclear transport factor 2 family protein [Ilumatobacteraceae bacterium]